MGKPTVAEREALGREAKRLRSDPLFNGVLNSMIADSLAKLTSHPPGSEIGTINHALIMGLEQVKQGLTRLENDGIVAQRESKE